MWRASMGDVTEYRLGGGAGGRAGRFERLAHGGGGGDGDDDESGVGRRGDRSLGRERVASPPLRQMHAHTSNLRDQVATRLQVTLRFTSPSHGSESQRRVTAPSSQGAESRLRVRDGRRGRQLAGVRAVRGRGGAGLALRTARRRAA